jgi:hypothetical protein
LRTEHAHRTAPDELYSTRHIGTSALVALDAQIAGSVLRLIA